MGIAAIAALLGLYMGERVKVKGENCSLKKWRCQRGGALVATTEALASQRSAFRPLLSHKPVYRFDNSCSDWSRAVWQSHTAWVAISRDCQI